MNELCRLSATASAVLPARGARVSPDMIDAAARIAATGPAPNALPTADRELLPRCAERLPIDPVGRN
jgi:hypothetical protein